MSHRELQAAIVQAEHVVQQEANHELLPYYRRAIYAAFGPPDASRTWQVRGMLAWLAGQRVLPLWQQHRPADLRPEQLLKMTEAVVQGRATFRAGQVAALTAAS